MLIYVWQVHAGRCSDFRTLLARPELSSSRKVVARLPSFLFRRVTMLWVGTAVSALYCRRLDTRSDLSSLVGTAHSASWVIAISSPYAPDVNVGGVSDIASYRSQVRESQASWRGRSLGYKSVGRTANHRCFWGYYTKLEVTTNVIIW
jgi:hypothetical protein